MSKFRILTLSAVLIYACLSIVSCIEKPIDNGNQQQNQVEAKNVFLHNADVHEIKSVVYTDKVKEGFRTFFFSPTRNIVDTTGMYAADDYLQVTLKKPENGVFADVDFSTEGNSVSYKDFVVEKNTVSGLKVKSFTIEQLTHKYLVLDMKFEATDGQLLEAHFYGFCTLFPEDKTLDWDYVLTSNMEAAYLGRDESDNSARYHFAMSTVPYEVTGDQKIMMSDEGYLFMTQLFAEAVEGCDKVFPTGTFKNSNRLTIGTYDSKNAAVLYYKQAGDMNPKPIFLKDDITVTMTETESGVRVYSMVTTFKDGEGITRTIGYTGPIVMMSGAAELPRLDEDVTDFVGYRGAGVYYGNMLQTNTGLVVINLYDEVYDKAAQGEISNGYAASLAVFNQMFNGDEEPKLIPGTYKIQKSPMGETNTALVGLPLNMMGMVMPFGTYVTKDADGKMGLFGWGYEGTITIEEASIKGNWIITFDFVTDKGRIMKGKFNGPIELTDQSDDGIKDDGTSTLNKDYQMNLDNIPVARLFPRGAAEGLDGIYGKQRLDIGSRSGWDEDAVLKVGDIFSAGLITRKDEEAMLAPGRYTIVTENWPYYIKPGWALKGEFIEQENGITDIDYTTWMHFDPNNPNFVMDGHAFIYEGEVVVERDPRDEEGIFTISLNGYCVRKYNVTGTWKGKVINAFTGKPVKAAVKFDNQTASKTRRNLVEMTPEMMKEAGLIYKANL